jgi:hypothetical protein
MIQFRCECGKLLQARDEDVGGIAVCPSCQAELRVPDDRDAIQAERRGRRADEERVRHAPEDDLPVRGRRESDREPDYTEPATSGKAVASMVLGALSILLVFLTGIPAVILGILGLRDIKCSRGRLGGQGVAIGGIVTGGIGIVVMTPLALLLLLIPAIDRVREAAARAQSQNNLKQMALAMHNYHDTFMHLPPAGGEQGMPGPPGPKMSWRVAILPFVEQDFLYRQYNPNEPWDSPNNKRLLNQMPKIYQLPGEETAPPGHTYYQVFVGPTAGFENPQGTRLMDVTDGVSNTLMIVEAETAVPWTEPQDLTFNPNGPLPRMGKHFRSGFNVVFMDGSARLMPHNVPETTLRAMITRNGGEMVTPP